jgi:hypothetical protein
MPWFFSFLLERPGSVHDHIRKREANCPVQRERNSSRVKCGGCHDRISLTRPRAPEITLNKSKYVEKFNLIQRQAFKTADARTANAQPKTGEFRVETRTVTLGGHIAVPSRRGSPTSIWRPHARQSSDQTQTVFEFRESGLVCLIDLAFFNFLLALVDAMIFLLPA